MAPSSPHLAALQGLESAADQAADPERQGVSLLAPELLRRANLVANLPLEQRSSFEAACGRGGELRALALDLATGPLLTALRRNLDVFTAWRHGDLPPLPLPQQLFFALLSAHASLCSCLLARGAAAEVRVRVLRAAVPLLDGILTASNSGYGFGLSHSSGEAWPTFFGSYGTLFLHEEVHDEVVLSEIRRRKLDTFFDAFVSSAREVGASPCAGWLDRMVGQGGSTPGDAQS